MNRINEHNLSDLYDISSGISTTKAQAGHGGPFVSFSTVFNNYFLPDELPDQMDTSETEQRTYSVKKGDILLTRTSETINELAMSSVSLKDYPHATFSGFTKRLRPKTQGVAYHKYLGFYLRGYLFRQAVTNHSIMTLRSSFNEEIFALLKVYLPEYDQQVKIGDFLYSIEQKIQLNNFISAELEKTAKLLYDYWFAQFDFPDENGKPYRSSGGAMEYNAQMKREIPKGWDVKTLGRVLEEIESGKRPVGGALQSGIPSIGAENIESFGVYDFKKEKYISQDFFSNMRKGVVKSGDVLLYKDGAYSGKASMALDGFPHQDCAVNEHVFILRTNNDVPSQFFLYLFLIRPENYNKLNAIASSKAAQPGLNQDQLDSVNVPVPPRELVLLFDRTISPMMHKIASCANQSKYLTALRDFLLPLLMNGQVTIKTEVVRT